MKKIKFSEKQILDILKGQDFGKTVAEISKMHGITPDMFHNWKNKYSVMNVLYYPQKLDSKLS